MPSSLPLSRRRKIDSSPTGEDGCVAIAAGRKASVWDLDGTPIFSTDRQPSTVSGVTFVGDTGDLASATWLTQRDLFVAGDAEGTVGYFYLPATDRVNAVIAIPLSIADGGAQNTTRRPKMERRVGVA